MGLNDLRLSPNLLSALYPSSLINSEEPVGSKSVQKTESRAEIPAKPAVEEPYWKYLGNNGKNILIVVSYPDAVHLPDDELGFLTNMLTACKLNLGDVAIINKNSYQDREYKEFLENFKSKIVLLFGVDPLAFGLPVGFPQFQVQSVANCKFLFSSSLEQTRNDSLLKSKLWVSLRSIFGI
ncbi:hypothetical protein [Terrimonas alba]|uniref:hypothetical protein n=1 Tax=Terrimonas alba TaxID=3349636 RepID=UPI0035F4F606